jgi:molybdopterin-guanine dinucleotide biosynthesis protein B
MSEPGNPPLKSPELPRNVISLVGPSGSGKTELICRLVAWFKAKGLTVAVLKHSHKTVLAESATARAYRQAGAQAVAQASPHLVQVNQYMSGEPDLAGTLAVVSPQADLVIVEGYKQSHLHKIALVDPDLENIPLDQTRVVAWVGREAATASIPVFSPDEVERIGMFILRFLGISFKGGTRRGEG